VNIPPGPDGHNPDEAACMLRDLVKQCLHDSERWFPDSKIPMWEVGNWEALDLVVLCLAGEVGEVANLVKKVRRGDFDQPFMETNPAYQRHMERIKEETTDVFVYLLNLFGLLGIDPLVEYNKVRDKNEARWGNR
jgi:NTP pyrophosphatase (non-canonical NTP hydrolase)